MILEPWAICSICSPIDTQRWRFLWSFLSIQFKDFHSPHTWHRHTDITSFDKSGLITILLHTITLHSTTQSHQTHHRCRKIKIPYKIDRAATPPSVDALSGARDIINLLLFIWNFNLIRLFRPNDMCLCVSLCVCAMCATTDLIKTA